MLQHLKKLYLNLSIRYKILFFFYLLITLPILVLSLYSYNTSRDNLINRLSVSNLAIIHQLDSEILFLQREISDLSSYIIINPAVQDMVKNAAAEQALSTERVIYLNSNALTFVSPLIATTSSLSNVIIYGKDGKLLQFMSSDASLVSSETVLDNPVFDKVRQLNGGWLWISSQENSTMFTNSSLYSKIALCRAIKDLNNNHIIGYLVMAVNEQTIRSLYANTIANATEGLLITDENNHVISSSGVPFYTVDANGTALPEHTQINAKGFYVGVINGKNMLVSYNTQTATGWRIYYAISTNKLTAQINSIMTITLTLIFLCLLISFPIVLFVSNSLTSPIKKLISVMKNFQQGDFDQRVNFTLYEDEIGQLGRGYNAMASNLKELINNVYVLQIMEREAELAALQAQINPHFLYNMLDTIYWKAYGGNENDTEIAQMVHSLSVMLRLCLNRGKALNTVAEEKELLENYLLLQKKRFKEKLEYELTIDSDILECLLPKLLLQPFVENAIVHGIEKQQAGGRVVLVGKREGRRLRFVLDDNGIGIPREMLDALCNNDKAPEAGNSQGGFAIHNVRERLRLQFGNDFRLELASEPGRGTKVTIEIPDTIADSDKRLNV